MRFRKRPVEVEAHLWDGNAVTAHLIAAWANGDEGGYITDWNDDTLPITWDAENDLLVIATLEGDMEASIGDWIIRGTRGEYYPCKPGPFEDTFERVDP